MLKFEFQLLATDAEVKQVAALLDGLGEPWMPKTLPPWSDRGLELLAILIGIYLGESFRKLRQSIIVTAVLTDALASSGVALLWIQGLWIGLTLPVISLPVMSGVSWLRRGALHQRQSNRSSGSWAKPPPLPLPLSFGSNAMRCCGMVNSKASKWRPRCCSPTRRISEQLSPTDLLTWLNRGMSLLVKEITNHGGIINKFTGDGVLAVFGAPISQGKAMNARGRLMLPWTLPIASSN